jgi:2-dehydro-3-deoxyphosphooctonate aldolase (KDO 8-P synthase)
VILPSPRKAQIRGITVGDGQPLALLAGPCVVEGRDITLRIAGQLVEMAAEARLPLIFKASFDKANRTSLHSFRGPGMQEALGVLAEVKSALGVPIVTDVHLPEQAAPAAQVADVLQIPAFLCRQTDLLLAAAATGKAVNVKKGQFLAPGDMAHVVEKLRQGGARDVLLTERGTFFGYGRLVNDLSSLPRMQALGVPVVFDATHSVQQPGGEGDRSGGDRSLAPYLARAAVAAGADAIFMEVHENPDQALSDGPNSLPLSILPRLLRTLGRLRELALEDPPGSEFVT